MNRAEIEKRAKALSNGLGWHVGRTDVTTWVDGKCVHYAYSPLGYRRVAFFGTPLSALRQAVKYAEKRNKGKDGKR